MHGLVSLPGRQAAKAGNSNRGKVFLHQPVVDYKHGETTRLYGIIMRQTESRRPGDVHICRPINNLCCFPFKLRFSILSNSALPDLSAKEAGIGACVFAD